MPGNVYLDNRIVKHFHFLCGQLVDNAPNVLFVAGDCAGRKHHQIVGIERNLCVIGECHAVKRRHGFALAARCNQRQLARLVAFNLVDVDQNTCGDLHISQFNCRADDVQHAAPGDGDLPFMPRAGVDDLLNTVYIGRECCNDDALLQMGGEDIFQRRADLLFGRRVSGTLCVGRFAQEHQDALAPQLTQTDDVHHVAVNRRGVQLEVAGVDQGSERGVQCDCAGIGNGVVHVNEFRFDCAEFHPVARLDGPQIRFPGQGVLLQFVFNDP